MSIFGLFIGILALLFTIYSFWWMNWRRGKLIVSKPLFFESHCDPKKEFYIKVPLIFYNHGAVTSVVENIRIKLKPYKQEEMIIYTDINQFSVESRKSNSLDIEFRANNNYRFNTDKYIFDIEVKYLSKESWISILSFNVNFNEELLKYLNSGSLHKYKIDWSSGEVFLSE